MGREKRFLIDGGTYHVISRGHNKDKLFHTSEDYNIYTGLMMRYKARFVFELFHYCLMPNHVHLLIRILKGNELPHLMQSINQAYAKHYQKTYGLFGNLFQGRYKGLFVEKDDYFLECGRYIERNPLRAGIIEDLSRYPFSSFDFYAKGKDDGLVTIDPLYEALSPQPKERRRMYLEYVMQPRPYEKVLDAGLKV